MCEESYRAESCQQSGTPAENAGGEASREAADCLESEPKPCVLNESFEARGCCCRNQFCESCCVGKALHTREELIEVLKTFQGIFMVTLTLDPTLFDGDPLRAFEYVKGKEGSGNKQHLIGELVRTLRKRGYLHTPRFFCVLECQRNGFPHWHLLLDASFIPVDVIRDRWDSFRPKDAGPVQGNRPAFGAVKFSAPKFADHKHAAHYACKYLIKHPENDFPAWLLDSSRVHRFTTSRGLFPKAELTPETLAARWDRLTKLAERCGLDPAIVVPEWFADSAVEREAWVKRLAEQCGVEPEVIADRLGRPRTDAIDSHERLAQFASESPLVTFSKHDGEADLDELEAFPPEISTIRIRRSRCKSKCVLLLVKQIESAAGIKEKRFFVCKLDVSLADLKAFLGRTEGGNGLLISSDEADRLRREFGAETIAQSRPYRELERLIEAVNAGDFDDDEAEAFERTWDYWDEPSPEPTGEDPPLQAGGPPAGRQTALACPLNGDDGCDGGPPLDSIDAFHAHLRDVHGVTGDQAWEFQNEAIDDLGDDVSRHRWNRAVDEALANLLFDEAADSDEKGEAA